MAEILRAAGLSVYEGLYSIRIEDCGHFALQQYGGDLGDPCIDADADTLEEMLRDAGLVSQALAGAGIRHRFEMYDESDVIVGYLHHEWPREDAE